MKRPQKISLDLSCEFTVEEMDAKRDRLSAAMLEYDATDEEKSDAVKSYNEHLKALHAEMRGLAKAINRKGEVRPVECLVEFHVPMIGTKRTVRLDTGEELKQEPMTDDERQENLFEENEALERMYDAVDERESAAPPLDKSDEQPESGA